MRRREFPMPPAGQCPQCPRVAPAAPDWQRGPHRRRGGRGARRSGDPPLPSPSTCRGCTDALWSRAMALRCSAVETGGVRCQRLAMLPRPRRRGCVCVALSLNSTMREKKSLLLLSTFFTRAQHEERCNKRAKRELK